MKPTLFVLALALLVFGCSKSEDSAGNTPPPTTKESPKAPSTPTNGDVSAAYKPVNDIFTKSCVKCHGGGGKPKAGIDLTSYASLMKGGAEGPIIVAGQPDKSVLIMALHGKDAKQMPPRGPLPDADIKVIEDWVKGGAKNS